MMFLILHSASMQKAEDSKKSVLSRFGRTQCLPEEDVVDDFPLHMVCLHSTTTESAVKQEKKMLHFVTFYIEIPTLNHIVFGSRFSLVALSLSPITETDSVKRFE